MEKTNVILLQSPLLPHSVLINGRLRERLNFALTNQLLLLCYIGKGGNEVVKADFLVLH